MKSLSLFSLIVFFCLPGNAQAATIFEIQSGVSVYANAVSGSSGVYYDQTFSGFDSSSPTTADALTAAVTGGDLTKYAWTPNAFLPTEKVPGADPVADAYIDLSFANNIFNGDGADLVLFFAGNGSNQSTGIKEYQFTIDVGADGTNEEGVFSVTTSSTSSIYDDDFYASFAIIDLDDFGFDQSTPLGDIRIHLGDISMPALAGLGAYHESPMVVPLPLSSVLFTSGLALLSLFRRKTQA